MKNFSSAVPVTATAEVPGTVRYCEQTLGFKQQWIWGDPPVYAGIRAGGALLYVTHDPIWRRQSKSAASLQTFFSG